MDFSNTLDIKKEKEDIEYQDKHDRFLEMTYDVKVKVEDDGSRFFEDFDWCIQKETVRQDNNELYFDVGCNDKLSRYMDKCSRCYRVFSDSYSLLRHNLTHLRIYLSSRLLQHYKHKCDICLVYYQTNKELENHKTKHLKEEKKFKECVKCQGLFTDKKLHGHMKVAHPTDEYYCGECNIKYKCAQYLRRHLLYHHGDANPSWRYHSVPDTEVKCKHCPNIFKNKSAFTTHVRNCHSGSHDCEICGSKLKSRPYLLTHMRRVHYNQINVNYHPHKKVFTMNLLFVFIFNAIWNGVSINYTDVQLNHAILSFDKDASLLQSTETLGTCIKLRFASKNGSVT